MISHASSPALNLKHLPQSIKEYIVILINTLAKPT